MRNLMKTGLFRLKRQKAFWISLLLMMVFGLVRTLSLNGDPDSTLASGFFIYVMILGLVMAVFCSLFIGTEATAHSAIRSSPDVPVRALFYLIFCFVRWRGWCSAWVI